jgi:hypothetical protein
VGTTEEKEKKKWARWWCEERGWVRVKEGRRRGGEGRGRCLDEENRVDAAIEFRVVGYLGVLGGERKVSSKERRGIEE